MKNKSLSSKAFTSFFWKFFERICAQVISLIVSIILARILDPEDYSVVSIVMIFFVFTDIFISGGLNTALIQKKDPDVVDYSTILYTNLVLSVVLYIIMFFLAPWIANLYHKELLVPVIRVMSLTFFINSIKAVLCAKISKELKFKQFFIATIVGTVISAFIGITMALNGFGSWALIAQKMSNSFVDTVILWFVTKMKFSLQYSFKRLKPMFSYGGKLMASSLITTTYNEIRPLVVGIKFSAVDLAFYSKGAQFPKTIYNTISSSLSSVLFPVMTYVQDDKEKVLELTRKFMRVCSYLIFPMMLGMLAVADKLIVILLTNKWMESVIFLRIFCISRMFTIIQDGNLQPIRAIGRSDVILKLDILKKAIYAVILIVFIVFSDSPQLLAFTSIITSFVASAINTTANRKLLGYKFKNQMWDLLENLIPSIVMCVIVYAIGFVPLNIYLLFSLQVVIGIALYVLFSLLFKNNNLFYLVNILKNMISKTNNNSKHEEENHET